MQHDSQYPASRPRTGTVLGALVVWTLIGLAGVLVASVLIAAIVMLWRVIL